MISEIRGKLDFTSEISKSEDKLTGSFFGGMRYLPYSKGLALLLEELNFYREEDSFLYKELILDQTEEFIGNHLEFWRMDKYGELDVEIDLDYLYIGVEVKYLSGLSSEDQLERELKIIDEKRGSKEGLLIFLAPNSLIGDALKSIDEISEDNLLKKVGFAYLSWESVYEKLAQKNQEYTPYESRIVDDILELLKYRGFEKFKSFQLGKYFKEISNNYFQFLENYELKLDYGFKDLEDKDFIYILEEEYYEFR